MTISVSKKRRKPDSRVFIRHAVSGHVIIRKRTSTNASVINTMNVCSKRGIAKGIVTRAVDIVKKRKGADSIVEIAAVIVDKSVSSNSHVFKAGCVEQQRSGAHCGI